jgi:hypothetical protein
VLRLDRARRCIQTGSEGKEDAGRVASGRFFQNRRQNPLDPPLPPPRGRTLLNTRSPRRPKARKKNPQLLHVLKEEEGHQRARSRRADTGTWSSKKATFRDATLLSVLSVSYTSLHLPIYPSLASNGVTMMLYCVSVLSVSLPLFLFLCLSFVMRPVLTEIMIMGSRKCARTGARNNRKRQQTRSARRRL